MVSYSVPSEDVVYTQSIVRACAATLLAYDYLRSLPAEWRFSRRSRASGSRWNRAYLLYLAVRYMTIVDIVLSTVGFFSGALGNPNACYPFIFVVRYLRCITASLCSAILAWRAWAICNRGKTLGWIIAGLFIAIAAIQIWSQSYSSLRIGTGGQCFASNPQPNYAVCFYAVNLLFDMFLAILATRQLWMNSAASGVVQPFTRTLIKEGLVYYLVCSAANVVNLVLWSQSPVSGIQSVASNLGIVLTSIMAQMLLLSLQEVTVIRDHTSEKDEMRHRGRKLGKGGVRTQLANVFGNGARQSTTASREGELSVKVHVDVLHTFEELDARDKERDVRPAVRNQSESHGREEKRGPIRGYMSEADSEKDTTTLDLELGPVSPHGPGMPHARH